MASPQEPQSADTRPSDNDMPDYLSDNSVSPSPATAPLSTSHDPEPHDPKHQDSEPEVEYERCFVCQDDVPVNNLPADWVRPCPCSLQGHQGCILDWIADLESKSKRIACPQCKSEIRTDERWDPVVKAGDAMTNMLSRWSLQILLGMFGLGASVASGFYGLEALQIFAGDEVTRQFVLRDNPVSPLPVFIQNRLNQFFPQISSYTIQHIPDLRLGNVCLLPLVGPALIINRLNLAGLWIVPSSVAVGIPIAAAMLNFSEGHQRLFLTRLLSQTLSWSFYRHGEILDTTAFHANYLNDDIPLENLMWPPTFDQALTFFPVMKSTYFFVYNRLAGALEARLDDRIKRYGMIRDNGPADQHNEAENGDGLEQDALGDQIQAVEAQANEEDNGDNVAGQDAGRQAPRLAALDAYPFNFLVGALMYPVVSWGAGEVLRCLLPKRMVSRPGAVATGMLQEQWGRSFVGGCLFVVLKDAFWLYVKYRRALNRPHRRVRDRRE